MKIVEIFQSIDGEVNAFHQGRLTTFIRLAGCNLRCDYCDTKESWNTEVRNVPVKAIVADPMVQESPNVTITGGEPLTQMMELIELLDFMNDSTIRGKKISIETNGTIIPTFPLDTYPNVRWVVDWKINAYNTFPLHRLTKNDFVKFVVGSKEEFDKAVSIIKELQKIISAQIALSAQINDNLPDVDTLIRWMREAKLYSVVLNVQIHKFLKLK